MPARIADPASRLFCLFFPGFCRVCDAPLRHARRLPVCDGCLQSIDTLRADGTCSRCGKAINTHIQPCIACRVHEPEYDSAQSWAAYDGCARQLIHLLKYERVMPAADYLAYQLAQLRLPAVDALVPVPLGRVRQRERGFNQIYKIGRRLARRLKIECRPELLRRRRETLSQAGLTAEQREDNVRAAFQVPRGQTVAGRKLLLLDDVLTTGATARACAAALKDAGAAEVHLLTAARADLWAMQAPVARRTEAHATDAAGATSEESQKGADQQWRTL